MSKYEGVSMFGTVNEFETLYEIADDIENRLISLTEISFEDEIISECEMSLETLQDYTREIGSVDEQESLSDFNNFSDLIERRPKNILQSRLRLSEQILPLCSWL